MLDEPTSGLDSFKARSICKLLHDLARKRGKCIVSTIHSPSSEAFFYFDRVLLMADGYTVFQGDAAESMEYFKTLKFDVPRLCNPADYFMKVLAINYPKRKEDDDKLEKLNQAYRFSIESRVRMENQLIKLDPPKEFVDNLPAYKASILTQLDQLFYRSWIFAQREPRLSRAKIFQMIVVAFFLIPVFWKINNYFGYPGGYPYTHTSPYGTPTDPTNAFMVSCNNTYPMANITYVYENTNPEFLNCYQTENKNAIDTAESNNSSMVGATYFLCVMQMFLNFLPTVIVFQGEKPVFVRERAGNMYDVWVYATTKMIAEIPIMLITPLLLTVMVYFAIGYQDKASEFFAFYFILLLMVQAATAMGYFLSSAFDSETAAVAFAPIINLPLTLLGGFMINLESIKHKAPQEFVEWVQYFSPVRYSFNGLMQA